MAEITESALAGEWFYLEEEQPLDRSSDSFYILQDSIARSNSEPTLRGTYAIEGDQVVIMFAHDAGVTRAISLRSTGDDFNETTEWLQADACYKFDDTDEPHNYYGAFVRRGADYVTAETIRARMSDRG